MTSRRTSTSAASASSCSSSSAASSCRSSIHAESAAPVRGFAIRRFFRIFPAYWLSVPLAAFAFFWVAGSPFSAGEVLVNLTLLQDVVGVRPAEGVYWTLLVDYVFYALCIALLLTRSLFSPRRIAIVAAALVVLHVFAMCMHWIGKPVASVALSFWPLNLSLMFFGTLYRLQATTAHDRVASTILKALGDLLRARAAGRRDGRDAQAADVHDRVRARLHRLHRRHRVARVETRLTDWLGRISYSIYLLHPVVAELIYLALLREPVDSPWRTQHLAVYLVGVAALTLCAASLAFRFVEAPAIRLGHRLAALRERRLAEIAARCRAVRSRYDLISAPRSRRHCRTAAAPARRSESSRRTAPA